MRKSYIWITVLSALLLAVSIGATVALLVSSSNPVVNTFTVGDVNITLTETTGRNYTMTPGVTVRKDPVVTVQSGSENCWLFVKVEKANAFDTYCTYEIQDGWTALAGQDGIFYQVVEKSSEDQNYPVLKNNCIWIKDSLTEEQLNAVTQNLTLKFTAYAMQSDNFYSANDAWQALNQ